MKFMQYDSITGKVITFYTTDIHGDNIPLGCIQISDDVWTEFLSNQNKYIVDVTKASAITGDTEIDSVDDIFEEVPVVLADVQANKVSELKIAYNIALASEFTSTASGSELVYSYDADSQTKFQKLLSYMSTGLLTYPTNVFTKDSQSISLDEAGLKQLFKDLGTFEFTLEAKLHALVVKVNEATTVDEVNAIVWE